VDTKYIVKLQNEPSCSTRNDHYDVAVDMAYHFSHFLSSTQLISPW